MAQIRGSSSRHRRIAGPAGPEEARRAAGSFPRLMGGTRSNFIAQRFGIRPSSLGCRGGWQQGVRWGGCTVLVARCGVGGERMGSKEQEPSSCPVGGFVQVVVSRKGGVAPRLVILKRCWRATVDTKPRLKL